MGRPSRGALPRTVILAGLLLVLLAPTPTGGSHGTYALPRADLPASSSPSVVGDHGGLGPVAPALSGASARMIVTTNDTSAVPDDGLQTNLTAFPAVSFPKNSSFQTGAEQVIGGFDAVFGLFTNDVMPPVAFFEVFNNSTDASVRLEYWTDLPIVQAAPYDFQLLATGGGTWALSVNGVLFGNNSTSADFDFGAPLATWEGGIGFSEVAIYSETTTVPSTYLATTALATHRPGAGWYLPTEASARFIGPPGDAWGVDGREEIPDLPPGGVESGTSLGAVDTNSSLWHGGPVAVDVSVAVSEPSVSGLGAVPVTVNVSSTSGEALGGVPVYVGDTLGGIATPGTVVTSAEGSSATILLAPNVSAAATDTVRAVVTVLGYVGGATTGLAIVPAQEVVVSSTPSSLVLTPNENVSITLRTDTPADQPAAGVTLTFEGETLNGIPGVPLSLVTSPDAAVTDGNGSVRIFVLAPSAGGVFAVYVNVASLGYWGHTNISVTVRALTPTFWQRYGSQVDLGTGIAALGLIAAAAVLLYRRRRRGRSALPAMDLRSMRQQRSSDDGPSGPTVSRTPPASGSP